MEIEKLFKALSDRTRVRVLLLLSQKKLCVCQLQKILKLPQSKLSKHLGKLWDLNLVVGYQDGKFINMNFLKIIFLKIF
ncbi:MAG: metalloregulator ArsR/SmtB family transcription factor [Lactococcus lactis]|nr:metalloregulator ArsR/SmtB family transcription factor [Lactococcus sp.]MDN5464841.1 metalloregulator ArsR/SmtB family transcription factor [Lactococcus lactis]